MKRTILCPYCGKPVQTRRSPALTVDVIIYTLKNEIVLVERKNEPHGWALPGGFVDYDETLEQAAIREIFEETGLTIQLDGLLGVYSSPDRDPRQHTVTVAYYGRSSYDMPPKGGDDARRACYFSLSDLPPLVFDHHRIVQDFLRISRKDKLGKKLETGASTCAASGREK